MPSKIQLDTITPATSGLDLKTSPNIIADASPLTGAIKLPVGDTSQRSSTLGEFRWNTTNSAVEWYTGAGYRTLALEGPYENISRSGMVLYFDSADKDSFTGSGTSITNLSKWAQFLGTIENGLSYDFAEQAFNFDSQNDVINVNAGIANTAMAFDVNDGFAVSVWFKADSGLQQGTGNAQKLLFSCANGAVSPVMRLGVAPNGGIFYADNNSNTNVINSGVNYNDDNWHNVTVTRGSGGSTVNVDVYVDNVLIGSKTGQPSFSVTTEVAVGGNRVGANTTDNFGGLISVVVAYNRQITPTEVGKLYTAFASRYV